MCDELVATASTLAIAVITVIATHTTRTPRAHGGARKYDDKVVEWKEKIPGTQISTHAVVPEEFLVLLQPEHRDIDRIEVESVRLWFSDALGVELVQVPALFKYHPGTGSGHSVTPYAGMTFKPRDLPWWGHNDAVQAASERARHEFRRYMAMRTVQRVVPKLDLGFAKRSLHRPDGPIVRKRREEVGLGG
jgi:hypothetical protein